MFTERLAVYRLCSDKAACYPPQSVHTRGRGGGGSGGSRGGAGTGSGPLAPAGGNGVHGLRYAKNIVSRWSPLPVVDIIEAERQALVDELFA